MDQQVFSFSVNFCHSLSMNFCLNLLNSYLNLVALNDFKQVSNSG